MGGAQRHLLHWCLGSEREKWKRAETIVRGEGFYARTQSHDPKPHETGVGIVRKPMKCLLGTTIFCHSVQPPMQFDWCRREYPLSFSVKVLIPLIKQPGSPWATPAAPSDQWLLPPPRPCSLGAPPVAGWALCPLERYTHAHAVLCKWGIFLKYSIRSPEAPFACCFSWHLTLSRWRGLISTGMGAQTTLQRAGGEGVGAHPSGGRGWVCCQCIEMFE